MKFFSNKNSFLILLLGVSLSYLGFMAQVFAGEVFYVFKDAEGRTYIEDSIPGELTKYGYKIINDKGVIIEEIPSVASKVKKARDKLRQVEVQRLKDMQKKKDQQLLRRFTSLEDIRETGNKQIMALQAQIDVTQNHIAAFKQNLSALEAHALRLADKFEPVSDDELRDIERMKENIQKNEKYITQRRKEQHRVRDEFLLLIDEYKRIITRN